MHILRPLFILIATLTAFGGVSSPAAAAESYDACVGFIDALPAVITTQGIWCLRQNLDTSAASGNMIDIQTNNVTSTATASGYAGLAAALPQPRWASMPRAG